MGFLDNLLGKRRTDEKSESTVNDGFDFNTGSGAAEKSAPMEIFKPTSFNDVERIIDALRSGKNAIVHLETLKPETALRVIDMLSGAVYALKGGLYEIQKNTYMFSPSGVTLK